MTPVTVDELEAEAEAALVSDIRLYRVLRRAAHTIRVLANERKDQT